MEIVSRVPPAPPERPPVSAWQHIALPACGCDACDEQVDSAIDDLVQYCTALAEGKLTERINISRRVLEHSWDGDGWGRSGTLTLSPKRETELRASLVQPPEGGPWRPWPIKGSVGIQ